MGTYLSRSEQEISESLREEYDIEAQPYLLHRRTQQLCTLHKLTASSPSEAARIRHAVEEYQRTRCESISKLRTHYHLPSSGYCSDEQHFFLVFEGQNNYSLREESAKRRLYRTAFTELEIQQVAEAMLCGLREYDHRFQRDYDRLSLDCVLIHQQTHRLYLRDPWLSGETAGGQGDPLTSLLLHYPSPQKLRAAHSNRCQDYKEFLSNLFTVGAIALELKRLQFADGIYVKKREVSIEEVRLRVTEFADQRMRKGLECLLSADPYERKKIFQMWGIENKEEHYLRPILNEREEAPSPITKINGTRKEEQVNVSPFNSLNHGLKSVPSETVIVSPLSFQKNGRIAQPLSSRSDHSNRFPSQNIITSQQALLNQLKPPSFTQFPSNSVHFQPIPRHFGPAPFPQQFTSHPVIHFRKPNPESFTPTNTTQTNAITSFPNYHNSHNQVQLLHPKSKIAQSHNVKLPHYHNLSQMATFVSPPTVQNSSISKQQSHAWSFNPLAEYKQSIYQPIFRNSEPSLQTLTESPTHQREVKSIFVEDRHEIPQLIEKSPSIIDKILADNTQHQDKSKQEAVQSVQKQSFIEKASKGAKLQTLIPTILPQNNAETPDTPVRPTAKNKYNSTIVQVRDEDSPLHSHISQQALQQEYVIEQYETGSRYEGYKSAGMRNGRGKFYYQDGGYYEGQWKNNKMDGQGRLYYEGGKLAYEGRWAQDEFNGLGKVYNDSPVPLIGAFDFTNFELLDDYWLFYEGMLVKDTKEGRGRINLTNGQVFEGDFHSDRIQGFGKFSTIEGRVIEGIWRQSKLIKIINSNSEK